MDEKGDMRSGIKQHKKAFIPPLQPKTSTDRIQNFNFKINRDDCYQDHLSLFVSAPSDTSLKSTEWIEYRPTNQINDTSSAS